MLLGLVANAHALALFCRGFDLAGTVPEGGATAFPVDARPAVTFVEGCTGQSGWLATLNLQDEADDAADLGFTAAGDELSESFLLEVVPWAPLAPDTAHVLTLTPAESEVVTLAFTTGTGTVVGLDGAPTMVEADASFLRSEGEITVSIRADPATDPDDLSILQVQDAEADRGVQSFVVPVTGDMEHTLIWKDSRKPAEVCPQVRQLDGRGDATEWSEPICVPVAGWAGCATVGPTAGLVGALLSFLLASARRARITES